MTHPAPAVTLDHRLAALNTITRLINTGGVNGETFHQIALELRPWIPFDVARPGPARAHGGSASSSTATITTATCRW
ncbi:MAG: hypothetical protein KatS3mg061_0191 [Dehalococcoidia bacterium]|nr:MAG: hypothetical protein KatS3mg061_0191 [Dehalococcoidia bacterium]